MFKNTCSIFLQLTLIYKIIHIISGFDKPLGPSQQNENLFSIEESVIIRTLPQYSDYHGLYYNELLKNINTGKMLPNSQFQLIKIGKEYRVLSE